MGNTRQILAPHSTASLLLGHKSVEDVSTLSSGPISYSSGISSV